MTDKLPIGPDDQIVVVEDRGFVLGVHAILIYNKGRKRTWFRPSLASQARVRRYMRGVGDFAGVRGGPSVFWVCPAPPALAKEATDTAGGKRKTRRRKKEIEAQA